MHIGCERLQARRGGGSRNLGDAAARRWRRPGLGPPVQPRDARYHSKPRRLPVGRAHQNVINGARCRLVHTQAEGRVALRIHVDEKRLIARFCHARRKIDGGRRLPHATLLIGDCVDSGHARDASAEGGQTPRWDRPPCASCVSSAQLYPSGRLRAIPGRRGKRDGVSATLTLDGDDDAGPFHKDRTGTGLNTSRPRSWRGTGGCQLGLVRLAFRATSPGSRRSEAMEPRTRPQPPAPPRPERLRRRSMQRPRAMSSTRECTGTAFRASHAAIARSRNPHERAALSTSQTRLSGRASASGTPGMPAPEPMSASERASRTAASSSATRESARCSSRARCGSRIAVVPAGHLAVARGVAPVGPRWWGSIGSGLPARRGETGPSCSLSPPAVHCRPRDRSRSMNPA